ncbi:nuclease [Defluviimonas sp. 20V17]|uniref:Nuclease n=1 Tax=Allgaiera indica TaxID=765699 RepID=A0AAN4USV5_9RHOB|nr:hypothetical protein [Allgaiera indica]KDB04620.1 nuclease [Defluviimonas sp. 20V17]GHE03724.1 nuclease [Allgaiera indica]SDX73828.1 hypothetical protein SAMN05444006_12714 [Allgaiera indica]
MTPAAALLYLLALAADPAPQVVDGDTIKTAPQGRMRLASIDAPESRGRAHCLSEALLAARAKARLAQLLPGARIEFTGRRDGWNRPLIHLRLADGHTAGEVLVSEGLARAWDGARRDWCH